jgi:hypothetical protein
MINVYVYVYRAIRFCSKTQLVLIILEAHMWKKPEAHTSLYNIWGSNFKQVVINKLELCDCINQT